MNDSVDVQDTAVANVTPGGALALPTSSKDNSTFYDNAGSSFLSRVQLYSKGKAVDNQLIATRHYGVPGAGDKIADLGDAPDFLVLARRPKAVTFEHPDFPIVQSFDPESDLFQQISDRKDEGGDDNGACVGISFLLFERTTQNFLEYYASSKSALMAADTLFGFLPTEGQSIDDLKAVTFGSQVINGKKFSWVAPTFTGCSTPITGCCPTKAVAEMTKFLEAKDTDMSQASTEASAEETAAAAAGNARR